MFQALLELELNSDLKAQLRELFIVGAKEVDVNGKKVQLCLYLQNNGYRCHFYSKF